MLPLLVSCSALDPGRERAARIEPLWRSSDSTSAGALMQLGRYYEGQQRLDLAIGAYQRALELDRNSVQLRSTMGMLLSRRGDYEGAAREFEAALALAPRLASTYNNLGYTRFLQGRYADAVAAYEKALALEPDNARTLNNLGAAYAEQGMATQASQAFESARAKAAQPALAASGAPASRLPSESVATGPSSPHTVPASLAQPDTITARVAAPEAVAARPALADRESAKPALPETLSARPALPGIASAKLAPTMPGAQPDGRMASAPAARPADQRRARLELSNGNGSTGMAAAVARLLREPGQPSARLTNAKPYVTQRTVLHYRPEFQQQAMALQGRLPAQVLMNASGDMRRDVDLRLVIGKDAAGKTGWLAQARQRPAALASRKGLTSGAADGKS
jgi:tetratricopeptide (TPR) repeat protein